MALSATIPKIAFVLGFFLLLVSARVPAGFDNSRGSIRMVQSTSFGARSIQKGDGQKYPVTDPGCLDPKEWLYTQSEPYPATILSVKDLAGTKESDYQVCEMKLEHDRNIPAWEGMCYIAVNLNNIAQRKYFCSASTRYGDDFDGKTTTLCVKRVGNLTNYMCNIAKVGDKIGLAGPSFALPKFTNMLLAQDNPTATQIMVATETGISPFRGYLRRMFVEDLPFKFQGLAWLIFGGNSSDSILYDEEFSHYAELYPDNFTYSKTSEGSTGVRDIISKNIADIYQTVVDGDGIISFSGREDMYNMTEKVFQAEAEKRGESWKMVLSTLERKNKWRAIVYKYGNENAEIETYNNPETYVMAI